MTIDDTEPNPSSDHILDWLEGSFPFLSNFFDDHPSCYAEDINNYTLWDQSQESATANGTPLVDTIKSTPTIDSYDISYPLPLSRKRKASDDERIAETSPNDQNLDIQNIQPTSENDNTHEPLEEAARVGTSAVNEKSTSKSNKAAQNNCNDTDKGRWAEQLLNPCAAAIASGNVTRAHHLLYVLQELASATGDVNHRLAAHGLRALTRQVSPPLLSSSSALTAKPVTFASVEPRCFQQYLLKFYEVSPWFAFPNNVANSSILQMLGDKEKEAHCPRNLHIIDIGVSHGVQWPTLLEALARRPGGPPPMVCITVVSAQAETAAESPFSVGPAGVNSSSRLLSFAKSMNINLHINVIENYPLQSLNSQLTKTSPDDILFVCAQFRLQQLTHHNPDEITEFLKMLRSLEPRGVILCENNMECCYKDCEDFGTGFSRRVELLWKFLDSTTAGFKGRECDERMMMEGEAAKVLTDGAEMNQGTENWFEKMKMADFVGQVFGEDVIDGARALLRRYDGHWEMRAEETTGGCISLWWKGQPVSFCSLWETSAK